MRIKRLQHRVELIEHGRVWLCACCYPRARPAIYLPEDGPRLPRLETLDDARQLERFGREIVELARRAIRESGKESGDE